MRIPLPRSAQRAEKLMRRFGLGEQADELIVTLNRAAEQAVPEARELLVQSVRKMSVRDAKQILSGGDTAATDYFRRTTRSATTFRASVTRNRIRPSAKADSVLAESNS